MAEDAMAIVGECRKNTIIKIPSVEEGFKTIRILKQKIRHSFL